MVILFPIIGLGTTLDEELNSMACELAIKIENREIQNLAVWQFEDLDASSETLGKHLSEDFSSYLLNSSNSLRVFERDQLDKILDELRLQNSGLIEQSTAQKLGAFTGVQAIVTGRYSIINNKIKLWIKVIETESAFQIAAFSRELPFDKKYFQPVKAKNTPKPVKFGKLKIKNKKRKSIIITLEGNNTTKTYQVDRKASSEILELEPGVYTCTIGHNTSYSFEKSEILIKENKKTLKKIKGKSGWPLLLGAGLLLSPILLINSSSSL